MKTFQIQKQPDGLYSTLLPDCSADVLHFVLTEEVPYVWLLDNRNEALGDRIQAEAKALFGNAKHEILVRCQAEFDFGLATEDFLAELPRAIAVCDTHGGVNLIQAYRPLPKQFFPAALTARSRTRVLRNLGVHLEFNLPCDHHPAIVEALDEEVLERVIRRVRAYFEDKEARSRKQKKPFDA